VKNKLGRQRECGYVWYSHKATTRILPYN